MKLIKPMVANKRRKNQRAGLDNPASSHYLMVMMILSTKTRMLKPLIKSVILSFQPLQAVGKETKNIDFLLFMCNTSNTRTGSYESTSFRDWKKPVVPATGFSFI